MSRKRMHWQLYPSYLFIVILSVAAMGLYGVEAQRQGFLRQVAEDLESRAHIIRVQAEELLLAGDHDRIRLLCDQTGHVAATRITIIGPDGVVYGDSDQIGRAHV